VYGSSSQRAATALVGKCMEGHDSGAGNSIAAELQGRYHVVRRMCLVRNIEIISKMTSHLISSRLAVRAADPLRPQGCMRGFRPFRTHRK
jgi:hypothetical protein